MGCEFNIKNNPHEEFLLGLRKGYNNIVVTTMCNINCCFCSRLFNPFKTEMYHRDFNDIIAEINACWPNKMKMINSSISRMTDGEPFTHPRIWDILKYTRNKFQFKGLNRLYDKIQITTNGTYLTEENLRKLEELKGIIVVHSINSTDPEDWMKLTGSSRKMAEIATSVPSLIKDFDIEYVPSIVAMPSVVGYEGIEKSIRDLAGYGAKSLRVFLPTYTKYASSEEQKMLSCDEDRLRKLVDKLREETKMNVWLYPYIHNDVKPKLAGFEHLGLMPDDEILTINGNKVFSRSDALNNILFFKGSKSLTIKTVKGDVEKKFFYSDDVNVNNYTENLPNKDINLNPASVVKAVESYDKILVLHSKGAEKLVKAAFEKVIRWKDELKKKQFHFKTVNSNFYGGNVICAGLLMCSDYKECLTEFIEQNSKPDIVLLSKDSFDILGRDLLKKSIYDVFSELDVKFDFVD